MMDFGILLLRIGVGVLFLNAAWSCGKDKAARDWTTAETGLVFSTYPRMFAMAGVMIMGIGGASVLLGVFGRIGGLALAGFLIGGTRIHLVQRQRAFEIQKQVVAAAPAGTINIETLDELAWSASLAHYSSALKNLSLIPVCLFLTLIGTGGWSIVDLDAWF